MSNNNNSQGGTRLSQMEYGSMENVPGTSPHIYQYNQQSLLRTSLAGSSNPPQSSTVRIPNKSSTPQSSSLSKSPGLTLLPRELINIKGGETGNQYISLPLRLENIAGSVQLVPDKSKIPGDRRSLIPVIVSGNEIYQIQGEGNQKNLVLFTNSQAGHTLPLTGSQNVNLGSLLSTSKAEGLQMQVPKSQTSFQEIQNVTSNLNSGNSTSQIMTGSVFSFSKEKSSRSVASPVYKSKLEKAMAQNLLMQSSAKSSGNKTPTMQSVAQKSIPDVLQSSVSEKTNLSASKVGLSARGPIPQEPVPQYVITEDNLTLKSTQKVSKVAEYYKNFVAGKGNQQHDRPESPLKARLVPQYSIVQDDFHTNPKLMDTFNMADGNAVDHMDVVAVNNQELCHMTVPMEHQDTAIREKTYEDFYMAKSILEKLWKLRQDGMFCDAVLYAGSDEIRLHKVVLIGVSPAIQEQVTKTSGTELQLVLPSDMLLENVMTLLYYIYNGLIKLTLSNVQQIYRLSGIFGLTQLSKHCYDFCKVAKMGHLIIGSPYQEAAKQIQKEIVTTEALPVTAPVERSVAQTTVTTSTLLSSPKLSTRTKTPVKNENQDNFETISSEIDWMTMDPSQSNIPIRKRGRNRKTTPNNQMKPTENDHAMNRTDQEIVENVQAVNTDNSVSETLETGIDNRNAHPKKNEVSRFELSQAIAEYELYIANENSAKDIEERNVNTSLDTEANVKQTELIEDIVDHLEALPDPLVSGKLDENELLKLKETEEKADKYGVERGIDITQTPHKPETRRFRTRANVSVMEAASQMKAKSNAMATISTAKNRRKKGQKRSPTVLNTDKKIGSEIKRLLTNPAKSVKEMELVTEKETGVAKTGLEPEKNVPKKYEVTPKKTNETKEMGDKENNNKDIETLKKVVEDLTGKSGTEGGDETHNVPSDIYPSAPKKAKFRKSTMEQQELKDTVYMRPPPKKRTKEIREMMKNEEDGKLRGKESFESSKTSADGELDKKEVEKENATKKVKKSKRKRPKVKNDIVMAKVYEIEKLAATVDAVKIYRCAFCSVEFKFAKRAVTHLIGTHDIDLDDTPDYVSVEKKSKNIKDLQECDICGFRPKESGTYYIHYHKYFRHQIPLPKGWHAYKCDLCQKEFFTKFQLREHKLIHFEDNPFVCEQCGSGFRSRTCLNSHVFHKHSSVRKHKCPDCPKTFKTATQMKVHQRVHTGEKPFLCPVELCNYRSTTRGNMKLHLNSKHKLTQAAVKSLMEALEASDVNADPLIFEESLESETNKQTLPREAATETGPFDILVQTATLENNNDVTDNHNQYMTSQMEVMTQDNVMVSSYNTSASGSNPILLNARDYSLVTQAAVQNQDLDMVIPEDNQMMENQNIPRHVEMLIQDAHQFMQHQDNQNQGQYVQDYQANTENEIQNLRSRLPEQPSLSQTYETPSGTISTRFSDNPQGHMTHKILDPHSKEARMMIREAFEGHGSRSLLKSAILHGNQENQRLEIGARHLQDNSNISESNSNLLNEAEKLVIDLHESGNHSIPLNQEDEVVQRLRSQIQQLRESTEQYRDSSIPIALFRNEHSVPEILIQNISSQQQNMEPAHFPAYHHATGSPPAYNSSSHGLINLPVSDIETQSSVTMTSVSQNESQGQIHSLQSLQGQGYTPVASQPASSQYGSDGTLYQGYYQEHYDIENY